MAVFAAGSAGACSLQAASGVVAARSGRCGAGAPRAESANTVATIRINREVHVGIFDPSDARPRWLVLRRIVVLRAHIVGFAKPQAALINILGKN
jgi:hypothetical protein